MQIIIPRTTDVSKVQQIANQQSAVNQQLLGEQLKQLTDQRQHQVQQLLPSEGGKVTPNKEKETNHQQKKHLLTASQSIDDDDEDPAEQEAILNHPSKNDPVRGHSIDIIT